MSTGVGLTVEIAVAAKMVKLLMHDDCLLDDLMAAHESVYVTRVLYVVCLQSVAFIQNNTFIAPHMHVNTSTMKHTGEQLADMRQ